MWGKNSQFWAFWLFGCPCERPLTAALWPGSTQFTHPTTAARLCSRGMGRLVSRYRMSNPNDSNRQSPVLGEALLHPIALSAVLLLLANDHYLKAHYPGIVTGKLSDLAGMVFFPLLLLTLIDGLLRLLRGHQGFTERHLVFCVAVTGLAFVLVKTTDIGAETFRTIWAALQWPARAVAAHHLVPIGRVRLVKDATDLVALPMLLVAYWVGRTVTTAPRA